VKFGCGGVDLNSKPALIPRKLLIFQHAKMPKTATRANLSFSFHSACLKRMNPDLNAIGRITIEHEILKGKFKK
jgi:hypothetical protein